MSDSKELTRYVHEGELLTPAGALRIDLRIDPVALRRAADALTRSIDSMRKATAGMAVPLSRLHRPAARDIIDQD